MGNFKPKLKYNLFIITILLYTSCSRVLYNVREVVRPGCAPENSHLTLSIKNEGKIGVTHLQIESEGKMIDLGGVEPGQSTCDISITPIYSRPRYKLYILKSNGKGILFETFPIDQIGEELFTEGQLELTLKVSRSNQGLSVKEFLVKRK